MPIDPSMMHLTGPIPGASLTRAPGSVPWEKPPQFTTVDAAMKFFLQQFQNEKNVHQFLATMEAGAPLDTVVYTILGHGFAEGKWTPSLGIMLIKPLIALLQAMLKAAKIKHIDTYSPKKGHLDDLFSMIDQKKAKDKVSQEQVKAFEAQVKIKEQTVTPAAVTNYPVKPSNQPPSGGLMSPPNAQPNSPPNPMQGPQ